MFKLTIFAVHGYSSYKRVTSKLAALFVGWSLGIFSVAVVDDANCRFVQGSVLLFLRCANIQHPNTKLSTMKFAPVFALLVSSATAFQAPSMTYAVGKKAPAKKVAAKKKPVATKSIKKSVSTHTLLCIRRWLE